MDISKFSSDAPGRLISLTDEDRAFIPEPLPPQGWKLASSLWPLIAQSRHELGLLEGIGRTLPSPELLLRPLQNREALRSSSLEGTYATPQQLLLLELETEADGPLEARPHSAVREVANYGMALKHAMASDLPLSLRLIRDTHGVLLRGVRGHERTPGSFRRGQVFVGHEKRFIPPPVNEMEHCLDEFEKYMNQADSLDPLIRCYLIHYQFETIHPFYDGNGRVGRLLLALMLQRWCRFTKPWLYMSAFFDRFKDEYISRLFNVSARAEWNEWLEFCLRGTIAQAQDTVDRCQRLLDLKATYQDRARQTKGSVRLSQLVDDLFVSPLTQIPRVERRLDITYPTAKSDVEALVKAGVLEELDDRRPRTFFAPDILAIAFDEPED